MLKFQIWNLKFEGRTIAFSTASPKNICGTFRFVLRAQFISGKIFLKIDVLRL